MSRIIREARLTDMDEIMLVMDAAKKIMRQSGNMHQWGEGYPSETVIAADIERNGGYVVEEDDGEHQSSDGEHQSSDGEHQSSGKIVGYFAFLSSPEPTYARIYEGKWLDDKLPYHVVHRIGSYPDVHGIFSSIMDFCSSKDPNIRIPVRIERIFSKSSFSEKSLIFVFIEKKCYGSRA